MSAICLIGQEDYESWLKEQQEALLQMSESQNRYLESISNQYDDFIAEENRLYENFKSAVENKWDEFKSSSSKIYVDYDNDLNARGSIDFENGVVEVEVIIDDEPNMTKEESKRKSDERLQNKLTDMVTKKAEDNKPLLENQLIDSDGRKVKQSTAESFAKNIVKEEIIEQQRFKAKNGKKKIKYSVRVIMQSDHIITRAERFKNSVIQQSNRFNIDPAIALAIMHTESSFNPKARSHIPAYGLMQLVPKSGARDAYFYVYNKDRLLEDTYLYVPKNNIELGCAFIAKIRHDYFKNIKDEKSAYICTISAYNTGVGNVAKTLIGKSKINDAAMKANTMNPDKLFNTLKTNLPYEETRKYLTKVTERIDFYRSWI